MLIALRFRFINPVEVMALASANCLTVLGFGIALHKLFMPSLGVAALAWLATWAWASLVEAWLLRRFVAR